MFKIGSLSDILMMRLCSFSSGSRALAQAIPKWFADLKSA